MKNINYRYARWHNLKQNRIGHVFQGRFRSIIVNDNHYLTNLCRYIHRNPVAANMVNQAEEYQWSSHHHYANNHAPAWMDINEMCSTIKNVTGLEYEKFISDDIDRNAWKPIIYISNKGEITQNKDIKPLAREEIKTSAMQQILSHELIIDAVCKEFNITLEQIITTSRCRRDSKYRIILAYFLRTYTNMSLSNISKLFEKSLGTISRQLIQFDKNKESLSYKIKIIRLMYKLDQLALNYQIRQKASLTRLSIDDLNVEIAAREKSCDRH